MRFLCLALVGLIGAQHANALVVESKNDEDKLGKMNVKPKLAYASSAALVATATAAQIVTPGWLQGALGKASEAGAGAAAVRAAEWLVCTRKKHPLGMTLAHGIVTKGCADLLAQTIPKGSEALVLVDKLRLFRSMLASLLSTSLPFYYWTKFMHHSFGGFKRWVEAKALAPLAEKVLTTGLGAATIKTVVTQALFRPINVGLFLILQSVFRGDTARQLQSVLDSKLKSSVIGGILFYSVSNLLMYSVPVPFLHPIMGSIAGLIFNVYLAIVAYQK